MSGFVLCRRNVAGVGEQARYCAKPITEPHPLDWCEACATRLPFWPTGDEGNGHGIPMVHGGGWE